MPLIIRVGLCVGREEKKEKKGQEARLPFYSLTPCVCRVLQLKKKI